MSPHPGPRPTVLAALLMGAFFAGGPALAGPFVLSGSFALSSFDPPQAVQSPIGASEASAVSNTGVVIGTYFTGTTFANATAFGYELNNGVYTTFTAPGAGTGSFNGTYGQGINSAGLALFLAYDNSGNPTNYLYKPATGMYTPINDPSAVPFGTFANSINDAGIVTGVYYDNAAQTDGHGFQYNVNTNTFTMLPDVPFPGASITAGQSTALNGNFLVNWLDASGNFHGALHTNAGYTQLDFPGAIETFTDGLNDTGAISGNYVDASGDTHGFVYANGTWYSIDYPGAAATVLFYNNDAGLVAGEWTQANTEVHSLLAVEVPEPGAWLSWVVLGMSGLPFWLRRRPARG